MDQLAVTDVDRHVTDRGAIEDQITRLGLIGRQLGREVVTAVLDIADRCVSPSDFGFHNAIVRGSGEICFIDFEYAGWDDSAQVFS